MPKIIKDLEEKILETAQHLFTLESYAGVDMRRIAKETGIATGTLYNYFSSKQDLLLAVVEHSWRVSVRRLEEGMSKNDDQEAPVARLIRLLYQEFRQNKILGMTRMQLMKPKHAKQMAKNPNLPPEPVRSLLQDIVPLFQKAVCQQYDCRMKPQFTGNLGRIVGALPMLIVSMEMLNAETPDENIQFLQDLVHGYMITQCV
jgi:AcrR family transcriptional regulator